MFSLCPQMNEFKKIRHLASEITEKGANIFDLLSKESEISVRYCEIISFFKINRNYLKKNHQNQEERNAILDSPLQLNDLEAKLKDLLTQTQKEIDGIHFRMDNVTQDEASLDAKIEKQEQELDRHSKRLEQLRSMRPAYQDEFERLEAELIRLYDEYVLKHRCLVHLEEQLDDLERIEQEAMQQREAQIAEMLAKSGETDEFDLLGNEDDLNDTVDLSSNHKNGSNRSTKQVRPISGRPTTGRPLTSSKVKVYGSLLDGDKDDDSLGDSFNLDDNVRDEDNPAVIEANDEDDDDNSELDSEEELELLQLTQGTKSGLSVVNGNPTRDLDGKETDIANRSSSKPQITNQATIAAIVHESDDDF
jgi:clusterin-associated protein 1